MGLFSSKPVPPPPTTVLGPKTSFEGELSTKREVELLGSLKGKVLTEGLLRIRKGALLEGTAACAELDVEGTLRGEADIVKTARFRDGAAFGGTLSYRALAVAPGARVEGTLRRSKS